MRARAWLSSDSSILCLFRPRSPFAVSRFVVAVVVYALKSQFWGRPLPHVVKKVLKTKPPLTHGYSSPAVVAEIFALRVKASLLHRLPYLIFSSLGLTVTGQCAAATHRPRCEMPRNRKKRLSAWAPAFIESPATIVSSGCFRDHVHAVKCLTDKLGAGFHGELFGRHTKESRSEDLFSFPRMRSV